MWLPEGLTVIGFGRRKVVHVQVNLFTEMLLARPLSLVIARRRLAGGRTRPPYSAAKSLSLSRTRLRISSRKSAPLPVMGSSIAETEIITREPVPQRWHELVQSFEQHGKKRLEGPGDQARERSNKRGV